MTRKQPDFLNEQVASAFQEKSVVEAYQYRPMYSGETFKFLTKLLPAGNKAVLDIGCGPGSIARNLVPLVDHLDAVDISSEMIEAGKKLPRGNHPNLYWHVGKAEVTFPQPPYSLITAGESLHWMDWQTILPSFSNVLGPDGFLVLLNLRTTTAWDNELIDIVRRYSTTQNFQSFNLAVELQERYLFQPLGSTVFTDEMTPQSVEHYIESFHGRASFSRERMAAQDYSDFDQALLALTKPFSENNMVQLYIHTELTWGKPLDGSSPA
jgi:ubiquinone/menaquinone biosynthesis C-methylase UbiE